MGSPNGKKLLMWAVCTLAFHGAFRIHELLSRGEVEFDPDFVLLSGDIRMKTEIKDDKDRFLEVRLKCPKESKAGNIVIVDVYETKGKLCPVKAFERWKTKHTDRQGLPLFSETDGTPLTGTKLNEWLKERLSKYIDYTKGSFTSHSFRIGLATTLATKGFNDEDIKEAGRWNSNSYELYVRLPRVKRNLTAKRIGQLKC